jgi:hypothetical protein
VWGPQFWADAGVFFAQEEIAMQKPEDGIVDVEAGKADRSSLSDAARRALAEAAERRRRAASTLPVIPKEVNGRDGPEPVRYGDWEVKGIASDF